MFFNIKYLTTAGKELLDQAAGGRTIIWGKCATSSRVHAIGDDVRGLTDIAVNGKYTSLGEVTTVEHGKIDPSSDANSNLIIKASLANQGQNVESGEARAFGVWAKLDESGTETLVVVAFWNLNNGHPETIPSFSQSNYSATVDLYIRTSDNVISTIESTSSWATPLSEFNNFKADVNSGLEELNERITAVDSSVSELSGIGTTVSKLDSDVSKLDSDVSKLDSDVSKLDSDVSKLDSDVSKLDSYVKTVDGEVNSLNIFKNSVVTICDANGFGTNQSIYGVKTFKDGAEFDNTTYFKCDLYVNGDIASEDLSCKTLNVTGQFGEDLRAQIARSLAGDSIDADNPVVGSMRLVAISEQNIRITTRAGSIIAGTCSTLNPDPLSGTIFVYPAAFVNGSFEILFYNQNQDPAYYGEGTWMLVTDLNPPGTGSYFSYALAVRIL